MTIKTKRRPRPSRGRGIRSTSGCITCRTRRLKCGEERPICSNCIKSSRECAYGPKDSSQTTNTSISGSGASKSLDRSVGEPASKNDETQTLTISNVRETFSQVEACGVHQSSEATPIDDHIRHNDLAIAPSPADTALSPTNATSFTAGAAPYHWYDLIARDAWKNVDQYQFLTKHGSRWSFSSSDIPSIPRAIQQFSPSLSSPSLERWPTGNTNRQQFSYQPDVPFQASTRNHDDNGASDARPFDCDESSVLQPWNTAQDVTLTKREVEYLYHYIDVVSPLLDLFDPQRHFQVHVVRLAMRNGGILKSVLAVAALHKSFFTAQSSGVLSVNNLVTQENAHPDHQDHEVAAQYYHETISWLSQAMQIPGYAHSPEILANAALISWYEAFESDTSMNWERHLKGGFWIQRSQNSDGESTGLRKAVWWSWLRQDIWAAIRHGRRTLTIHRPSKLAGELSPDDLACRILFIQAKAVSYASPEAQQMLELEQRLAEGQELLAMLREWYSLLPDIFRPLTMTIKSSDSTSSPYPPIWIHPPMFAAAMQAYYSATLLILVNMPSPGGRQAYQERQKMLDDCVCNICGIAGAPNAEFPPLALVNSQALFIAGQSLQTSKHEKEIVRLLRFSLNIIKIPAKTLETELRQLWSST